MISTITTATGSTAALALSLGFIPVLTLFALLVSRELLASSPGASERRIQQMLNVLILPLLVAFAFIVLFNVFHIAG